MLKNRVYIFINYPLFQSSSMQTSDKHPIPCKNTCETSDKHPNPCKNPFARQTINTNTHVNNCMQEQRTKSKCNLTSSICYALVEKGVTFSRQVNACVDVLS